MQAEPARGRTAVAVVVAALAYLVAMALLAWPLPRQAAEAVADPATPWGRADQDLLLWILAWVAHALTTDPLHVFDGNTFHPARDVIAGSEHLLGLAPVSVPAWVASGNVPLTYNVTIAVVVLLAALSMFALVRAWTGDGLAAWTAGAAFAFAPHVLVGWSRLHVTAVHFFPLVVLLAWRAAAAPSRGRLVALALVTAAQALAGIYVAYELALLLVAVLPLLWWQARRHGRSLVPVLAALAIGSASLVLVALPYLRGLHGGVIHGVDDPQGGMLVGPPGALLAAALAGSWMLVAPLAFAGVVLAGPRAVRVGLVVVAVVGFVFALGPLVPGLYTVALHVVPGLVGVRAPSRFFVVCAVAVAALAGLGTAALRRVLARVASPGVAATFAAGVGAIIVLMEVPPTGLPLRNVGPRAAIFAPHRWLAAHGEGRPVLEVPAMTVALDTFALPVTTTAMLGSTLGWWPVVNGYTGHPPRSAPLLMTLAQRLPERETTIILARLTNVGWVVTHRLAQLPPSWRTPPLLHMAAMLGDGHIYRVAVPGGDLLGRLRESLAQDDGRTLLGTPRRPLRGTAARGWLRARGPKHLGAGFVGLLWFDVTNRSRVVWPGLSPWTTDTVSVCARWRERRSGRLATEPFCLPLARDLAPGETVSAQAQLVIPGPGRYRLEVGLAQPTADGGLHWLADEAGGTRLWRRSVVTLLPGAPR